MLHATSMSRSAVDLLDYRLRALNDDCLHIIYVFLRPHGALRPLSLTCRWLRENTKAVLFERSYAIAAKLKDTEGLPPPSLCLFANQYISAATDIRR